MRIANEIAADAMELIVRGLRAGMRESQAAAIWQGFVHGQGTARSRRRPGAAVLARLGRPRHQDVHVDGRPAGDRATSRCCSRSGCAPTATGRITPRTSSSASCARTTASSRSGSWPSTTARSPIASRARASPSSTCSCATGSPRWATRGSPRIRSATASARGRTSRRTRIAPAAARSRQGMVLAIEPGVYWEGGGGLRVEDNFLIGSERRREALGVPGRGGEVLMSDLIWTGGLNDPYRLGGQRRPLRHDAARRRADRRRRARPRAEARDRAAARRARDRPHRGRLPAGLAGRLGCGEADRGCRPARAGVGLLPRGAGRSRGARRARRAGVGDRVADLRSEAGGDRRRPREDARPDHERDALRRRARDPRRVLRRRLDRAPIRRSTSGSTSRPSRPVRAKSPSSTRSASPGPRRSPTSSARRSSGSARTCRCTSTATTTSGSRPARPSRPCAPAPGGSTGRSTAWASGPGTRTSARWR